jgi:hypothetical protein
MGVVASAIGFILLIIMVLLVMIYRKKVWALLLDMAIGTVVYIGSIFFVSWLGIRLPVLWSQWGYPVVMIAFIVYHIIINFSKPSGSKPWGSI